MRNTLYEWISLAADLIIFVAALLFTVGAVLTLVSKAIDAYGMLL